VRLSGATVLLTGASGGLGEAIARELHRRGAGLVLTGRRAEVLDALALELDARAVASDLADRAQVERLVAEAGTVDVLVANAALPGTGLLERMAIEEVDRVLEVNLRAPIALAHALAPAMAARGGGHLLFVSSLAGKAAAARSALYNATKFGLRGFALALRRDLRPSNVGVSVVCPGFISEAGLFADSGAKLPPGVGTRSPHEVARAIAEAIEHNRGEVDVAPLPLRVGTLLAGAVPDLAATLTRLAGGDRLAASIADGQRDKR
jgi:short-subunit dehydrogenase